MKQKFLFASSKFFVLSLVSCFLPACFSHYPAPEHESLREQKETQEEQRLENARPSPELAEPSAQQGAAEDPALTEAKLAMFINRKIYQLESFSASDFAFVLSLPAESSQGSTYEAAKALAAIHWCLQEGTKLQQNQAENTAANETDLQKQYLDSIGPGPATEEGLNQTQGDHLSLNSLEAAARHFHVDLASALAHNPFLKSYELALLALKCLQQNQDTEAYKAELSQAMQANLRAWTDLGKQLLPLEGEAKEGASQEETQSSTLESSSSPAIAPPLAFGHGELASDEELMKKSQAYIDEAKYTEAIQLFKQVKQDNVFYAEAQDKIKEASNLAVQELRRKAAKSFQSAIPVADRKARAAYLEEAKRYLLSALELYPDADQLQTVKENLSVINKNLDLLNAHAPNH